MVTRKVSAALAASHADVEIIVLGDGPSSRTIDGAFVVTRLPATTPDFRRARLLVTAFTNGAKSYNIPAAAQEELLRLGGGDSPHLLDYLARNDFHTVVVAGYWQAGVARCASQLASRSRLVVLPLAGDEAPIGLSIYGELLSSASVILTTTDYERFRSLDAVAHSADAEVINVGMFLSVNPLARQTPAPEIDTDSYLLVLGSLSATSPGSRAEALATFLVNRCDTTTVFVNRGEVVVTTPESRVSRSRLTGRTNLWRLISKASISVHLDHSRLFDREVLESLLYGVPVVVPHKGAGREHAERGNGGLWYSDAFELRECVGVVSNGSIGESLGRQGHTYARRNYGRRDEFIHRIARAVGVNAPTTA